QPDRQPAPLRLSQPAVQDADSRRALRHARLPARRAADARPAVDRDGVRVRDGDSSREGEARDPRAPDRAPPARRRVEALALPRRVAPSAADARPQPNLPLRPAWAAAARPRRARDDARARPRVALRPRPLHPYADRRLALLRGRLPADRLRALWTHVRRLPPRRARRLARADADAVPARARAARRLGALANGPRDRRRHRRQVVRSWARKPRRGELGGGRRHARDHRRPDLLHRIPPLDPRPSAPARLTGVPPARLDRPESATSSSVAAPHTLSITRGSGAAGA